MKRLRRTCLVVSRLGPRERCRAEPNLSSNPTQVHHSDKSFFFLRTEQVKHRREIYVLLVEFHSQEARRNRESTFSTYRKWPQLDGVAWAKVERAQKHMEYQPGRAEVTVLCSRTWKEQ